jgi:hypothetical protein
LIASTPHPFVASFFPTLQICWPQLHSCRGKRNLFGIQVISEPHLHTDEGHSFLESYYQQAILAAREFLDPSVPIVLFEWTYEMCKWDDNAFPESIYGKVAWPNARQLTIKDQHGV